MRVQLGREVERNVEVGRLLRRVRLGIALNCDYGTAAFFQTGKLFSIRASLSPWKSE